MLARRFQTFRLIVLTVGVAGCGGDATAPSDGRLVISFDALPPSGQAAVTVAGPNGFSRSITSLDTLDGLARGTYTVTATEVTTGVARYRATPASQVVDVPANGLAAANPISYQVASSRLTVSVLGLPASSGAGIAVTGPNAFSRTLTATTTLDLLEPGPYTIASSDVQAAGKTYRPSPASQTVTLTPSIVATTAVVGYGAGSGTLEINVAGLPAGTLAAITVAGPGGFVRTVTATSTLAYLEAGSYLVGAAVAGSDLTTHRPAIASQTVDVRDGGTVATTVSYGSSPLALGLELVIGGLTSPLFATAPDADPRLFIVERTGRIRIFKSGALAPTPFLDIANRVNFAGERGLLGMAFDPDYATNGRFYVYYVDLRGDVALERFTSTPGEDIAGASGGIVLTIPHGRSEHHGGMLAFGPDGMLYLGPGDGGCCGDPNNNAQNLGTLLGKILRIDVRASPYAVPPGNPFVGTVGLRPEIWAYGLRNPWRFSFDAAAGLVYIGDVGQDAREEVDVSPVTAAGRNYGWRRMEGNACYNPTSNCDPGNTFTRPLLEYLHAEGCSVTAGYVYRGAAMPELTGHYLYSDYCRGWLKSFRVTAGAATTHRTWLDVSAPGTVSFGRDGAGELYMIGQDKVWRIVRR